jgi:hypothetical protein
MNAATKQRLGLTEKKPSGCWLKAKETMKITGWSAQEMHRARKYGYIEWEKNEEKGFIYNINSIPTQLIKQAA